MGRFLIMVATLCVGCMAQQTIEVPDYRLYEFSFVLYRDQASTVLLELRDPGGEHAFVQFVVRGTHVLTVTSSEGVCRAIEGKKPARRVDCHEATRLYRDAHRRIKERIEAAKRKRSAAPQKI